MKRCYKIALCCLFVLLGAVACTDDPVQEALSDDGRLVTGFWIASPLPVHAGQTLTMLGTGFAEGDVVRFESGTGSFESPLAQVSESFACTTVPAGMASGGYDLTLVRGAASQRLARVNLRITLDPTRIPDREGATIKGVVYCGLEPVAGVRVSDGFETAVTDADGYYWLASDKRQGYVFVSLPSGYEAESTDTTAPAFWAPLAEAADVCEQHDFELRRVDQSRHVMIVAADLHLANRPTATGDLRQFAEGFIAETTAFASAQSVPTYLMVLGDMTWDEFWYSNLYSLSNYRTTMQGYPVPIYHTMGNHDNDPYFAGDFAAEAAYRKALGPTYYSFDVGEVHYVMLDNTVYINTGGTEGSMGKRNYHSYVTDQQLAWLRDDLAALRDKSQPVVVGMHCPAMNNYNAAFENRESFNPAGKTQELFDCFEGFSDVHCLTGHTHYNANMERGAIFEHNVAAVCETWWWAGKLSGVGVCKDGSPAGYAVYEADGRKLNWYYKGVGQDRDKQFRTYDMNKVREFYTPAVIEILSQWPRRADDGAGDDYFDVADNTVFINVWNWDSQWTLRVTENGRELPVERVWHRDPLHTICLDYARILNGLDPVNDWESLRHSHMFRVVASSPRTSLHVEATDRFGRRYEETMRRPKEFTADMN